MPVIYCVTGEGFSHFDESIAIKKEDVHTHTFRKAHGAPCSCCPPTPALTRCPTFTAFCHNTDRQEANVSFIRACFQSALMMNISHLPHAAPEYSETKASYEIILTLE